MADIKDLPPVASVKRRCYSSPTDTVPSSDLNECGGGTHGTWVATSIFDMVDGAALYVSNAARIEDRDSGKVRLKEDVNWMIRGRSGHH